LFEEKRQKGPDARQDLIERYLWQSLANQELYLNYQPQYHSQLDKIEAFEALLRWKSAILGEVEPRLLIKSAEATGLIVPIGEWVLQTACRFIRQVHQEGAVDCRIAVNVSVVQLLQEDFGEKVLAILQTVGLPAPYLELELTETLPLEPDRCLVKQLQFLKTAGVRFALDDFGTGYASLSCLKRLSVDTLKIDKSFLDALLVSEKGRVLTESIIYLGRRLGLDVVAEGVENQAQMDCLATLNCYRIQGYYYSKPINEEDALLLVKGRGANRFK
jgi:EAL domain-containing protein (putative c-di-GMP-specific phosphodiesterase class I)